MKKGSPWILVVACSAGIVIAGALTAHWMMARTDRQMRTRLLLQATAIARQISVGQIQALSFSPSDKDNVVYQRLHDQMSAYTSAIKSSFGTEGRYLGIYSMVMRDGIILFGPENTNPGDLHSALPGTSYERPPYELLKVFDSGLPLTFGPYTDEFGTSVSAFVPVLDPRTGKVMLVIGMDFEATDWGADIAAVSRLPVLFVIVLLLIVAGAFFLVTKRDQIAPENRNGLMRNADAVIAAVFGLTVTLIAAYLVHIGERFDRSETFQQLAASKTFGFTQAMKDIRDDYLEGFSRFIESRPDMDLKQFNEYAGFLSRNPAVQAWVWIPRVTGAEKEDFVRRIRSENMTNYTIWQPDANGDPVPATGRDEYYPACYLEPLPGNERILGFDLGSEGIRMEALKSAAKTGLVTSTDVINLMNEKDGEKGIVILRPVYNGKELRGFALAGIVIETLLRKYILDEPFAERPTAFVDLYVLNGSSPGVLFASTSRERSQADIRKSVVMPVFAFGKTYAVFAHPGSGFSDLYPAWAGWLTGAIGMAFTVSSVLFIAFLSGRRTILEKQVRQRTDELRASEESYRRQFTDNSSVMLLVDPEDGRIMDANLSAVGFYGYSREKLCELRMAQLDTSLEKVFLKVKPLVDSGKMKHFQARHRISGGGIRDVEMFSSPIFLGEKKLLHFIIHDITERVKMEEDIKKKVGEFEIMNKVAVNRELRMVELKEKIAELEEKIKKSGS
ncbi:MAG: CHASE domain-containing protein [Candidatus Omnitrophota bacterium]|jgi:PAS domain S-box-containing protein